MTQRFWLPHRWIRNPDERLNVGFVQDNFEAVEQGVEQALTPVPVVTSLPAIPFDGMAVDYVADSTNGVVWRFRYRTAASGSYKWEFVGGGYLYSEVAASEARGATSYGALTTAGPSITVPLAGDYDVAIGCNAYTTTSGIEAYMSYDIGGTGASDGDNISFWSATVSTNSNTANGYRLRRKTALAASTALVAKYKTSSATSWTFRQRFMSVIPVRVG